VENVDIYNEAYYAKIGNFISLVKLQGYVGLRSSWTLGSIRHSAWGYGKVTADLSAYALKPVHERALRSAVFSVMPKIPKATRNATTEDGVGSLRLASEHYSFPSATKAQTLPPSIHFVICHQCPFWYPFQCCCPSVENDTDSRMSSLMLPDRFLRSTRLVCRFPTGVGLTSKKWE